MCFKILLYLLRKIIHIKNVFKHCLVVQYILVEYYSEGPMKQRKIIESQRASSIQSTQGSGWIMLVDLRHFYCVHTAKTIDIWWTPSQSYGAADPNLGKKHRNTVRSYDSSHTTGIASTILLLSTSCLTTLKENISKVLELAMKCSI